MTGNFEDATAVHRIGPADDSGAVRFDARVHPGWDINGNANGGYLLAIAGRAMAEAAGRPPISITAHYLAPAPDGPCSVTVRAVRVGRRTATYAATLRQDGRDVIEVLGTFAEAAHNEVMVRDGAPPHLPAYAACPEPERVTDGPIPALNDRLVTRMRPGDDGFRHGAPTGRPEIAGWFAFADDEPIDEIGLLLAADAFAPPVFNVEIPVSWVPTLELTVHVRGVPAPGPLACVFRTRFIQGGLLEEDGEMWDVSGALVAQSRQLALVPRT